MFSENIGPDDTVVRSGSLETVLIGGGRHGAEGFTFEIQASSKLFFYNPAKGNLLLDVRIFQGNTNGLLTVYPVFDTVDVTNDSVSRVWSTDGFWSGGVGGVNASTGQVDTVGLPTLIFFWANPKLRVEVQTNSAVLTWPIPAYVPAPLQTVLETSQNVSLQAQWQAVTNSIVTSNFVNYYTIRLDSAEAAAYFRLVSTTPP
jgi:hypothetical protein